MSSVTYTHLHAARRANKSAQCERDAEKEGGSLATMLHYDYMRLAKKTSVLCEAMLCIFLNQREVL